MYRNILLRIYSANSYYLSLLGKRDENFDNVSNVVSDFWSAIATHPGKTDYRLHFHRFVVHGTFNDWHNNSLKQHKKASLRHFTSTNSTMN